MTAGNETIITSAVPDFKLAHVEFDAMKDGDIARQGKIEQYWKYYDGLHKKFLKVKITEGSYDDNVVINFCGILVDRSVSRLFGDPLRGESLTFDVERKEDMSRKFALTQEGIETPKTVPTSEELKAQMILDQSWTAAGGLEKFLYDLGVQGGVTGHFVIKILRDPTEILRPVVIDPATFSALMAPDDKSKIRAYKIEYPEKKRDPKDSTKVIDADFRQIILNGIAFGGPEGWYVQDFIRYRRASMPQKEWEWEPISGMDVWEFCPIIEGQNLPHAKSFWGKSDMDNVTGLNDEINFLMSNVNRIVRYHAHPRTIGIGIEAGDIQETAVESMWTVATTPDKAEIFNLEMKSDLGAIFDFFQIVREGFWTIGREADPSVFKEKIGNVTNFGLRVLFLDALNKLGQKRQVYGKALTILGEYILQDRNMPGMTIVPRWGDPLPSDPREAVETSVLELDAGMVSRETAARERGRNWTIEKSRMREDEETGGFGRAFLRALRGGDAPKATPNVDRRNLTGEQ